MNPIRIFALSFFLISAASLQALADDFFSESSEERGALLITEEEVQWVKGPESLPEGSEVAILDGQPDAFNQMLTLRLKFPAGYVVPPHWHPITEHVTVMSGQLAVGLGTELLEEEMMTLTPGGFFLAPAQEPHYVKAVEDTVIQLHAYGPFKITYVDPEDDPRHR